MTLSRNEIDTARKENLLLDKTIVLLSYQDLQQYERSFHYKDFVSKFNNQFF